ncbi:MAG TPA: hypothetical protein VM513_04985 [Kofleriaceae bacterium]|nr:hypothetical protein [Kofleriaceae bacterium]
MNATVDLDLIASALRSLWCEAPGKVLASSKGPRMVSVDAGVHVHVHIDDDVHEDLA